jgi:hypothetical protein
MDPPRQLRSAADDRDDISITRREHEDENVIVVDFGPGVEASVDVVGDVVIVVAGDEQYEFERPSEATDIRTNDGMLIITE